jgi:pre-mRNA-splicing factor SYF1
LISDHPQEIKSLNVEAILRSGLRKFAEQVAQLWCSLAKHYVQLNQMEKARDIYEVLIHFLIYAENL